MTTLARSQALRATLLTCAAIGVVNFASVAFDRRDHLDSAVLAVDLAHGVVALGVITVLWLARARVSTRACELALVIATLPFLVGIWLPQLSDLRAGRLSEPLLAHHFLLLGIAVGSPTLRTSLALIALFAIHGLVLGHVLATAGPTPTLDHEPGFTLLFTVIAGLLTFTRARRRDMEHRLVAAEQRARVLSQVSAMLLALRDRANTPLQTLEVAITMLEADTAGDDRRLVLMRRALARLVAIQHALDAGELRSSEIEIPVDLEASVRALLDEAA